MKVKCDKILPQMTETGEILKTEESEHKPETPRHVSDLITHIIIDNNHTQRHLANAASMPNLQPLNL